MAKYEIADVVFSFNAKRLATEKFLSAYEYLGDRPSEFSYTATEEDEKREFVENCPEWYIESLALFRKLCEYVLDNADGIIFHASAICIDGKGYLFTAPSGTGKSTHTRLLKYLLGDRAFMINDDKPIIRRVGGEFFVYGTPWKGKHFLGEKCKVKIEGVCKLYRAQENVIRKAQKKDMIITVLEQTLRFSQTDRTEKLLSLIDGLLNGVKLYSLGCNMQLEAAKTSYNAMVKGEENEN